MACHRAFFVGIFQAIQEERRIAHYRIEFQLIYHFKQLHLLFLLPIQFHQVSTDFSQSSLAVQSKILQTAMLYGDSISERTSRHILTSLTASILINVDAHDFRLRKTLSHHQGNQARSTTNIQYALAPRSPSSQQHAIRTHLHGTTVLTYGELLEREHDEIYFRFNFRSSFRLVAWMLRPWRVICVRMRSML